jgi:hypothetical protein
MTAELMIGGNVSAREHTDTPSRDDATNPSPPPNSHTARMQNEPTRESLECVVEALRKANVASRSRQRCTSAYEQTRDELQRRRSRVRLVTVLTLDSCFQATAKKSTVEISNQNRMISDMVF